MCCQYLVLLVDELFFLDFYTVILPRQFHYIGLQFALLVSPCPFRIILRIYERFPSIPNQHVPSDNRQFARKMLILLYTLTPTLQAMGHIRLDRPEIEYPNLKYDFISIEFLLIYIR